MAFRLCRSRGAQVTSPTLLIVLQRRGIGLQGEQLKEGKAAFPTAIISHVPSYVNATAASRVRDHRVCPIWARSSSKSRPPAPGTSCPVWSTTDRRGFSLRSVPIGQKECLGVALNVPRRRIEQWP